MLLLLAKIPLGPHQIKLTGSDGTKKSDQKVGNQETKVAKDSDQNARNEDNSLMWSTSLSLGQRSHTIIESMPGVSQQTVWKKQREWR